MRGTRAQHVSARQPRHWHGSRRADKRPQGSKWRTSRGGRQQRARHVVNTTRPAGHDASARFEVWRTVDEWGGLAADASHRRDPDEAGTCKW